MLKLRWWLFVLLKWKPALSHEYIEKWCVYSYIMLFCGFTVARKPRDLCPTPEYCKGCYTHCSKRECYKIPNGHERTALHIHTNIKVWCVTLCFGMQVIVWKSCVCYAWIASPVESWGNFISWLWRLLYCQNVVHRFLWNSGKYIPHCIVSHMKRHGNSSMKLLETNCQST